MARGLMVQIKSRFLKLLVVGPSKVQKLGRHTRV